MSQESANSDARQNTAAKKEYSAEYEARKWQKGQSGNPGGRPKRKPITEMYERIMDDPAAIAAMERALLKMLQKPNMAMVLQLREMADRTEGKVTLPIEADVSVNLADAIAEARKRAGK